MVPGRGLGRPRAGRDTAVTESISIDPQHRNVSHKARDCAYKTTSPSSASFLIRSPKIPEGGQSQSSSRALFPREVEGQLGLFKHQFLALAGSDQGCGECLKGVSKSKSECDSQTQQSPDCSALESSEHMCTVIQTVASLRSFILPALLLNRLASAN